VGPAPDEYAVDIADNDQRNMTIHQIIGAYNEGLISADTYIWKEGMADWQTLAEVREVADALRAAARPVAATPAAVRRPDQGTTPDLFSRIHTAGSEDDITTSAPEPAPALTAGTGARNESSVLFSLSALTGTAGPTSSSSAAPKRGRDDSGLIDLHALTAAAEAAGPGGGFSAPAGAFGASPLISAPLGSGATPLGAGMLQGYGQRSGSRLNLIIAILLLAIGIIGGAAFLVNRGNANEAEQQALREPKKETNPSALAHEAAPKAAEPVSDRSKAIEETSAGKPSAKPEAAVPPAITPKELPSAAPQPAAAPRPAPHPQIVRISKPAPRSSVSPLPPAPMPTVEPPAPKPAKPAAEAAATEPKKKPVPACICKPADLLCAMKCSAAKK
jgi:hypothetical protein